MLFLYVCIHESVRFFLIKKIIDILFKIVLSYINMKINLIYSSGFNKNVIIEDVTCINFFNSTDSYHC